MTWEKTKKFGKVFFVLFIISTTQLAYLANQDMKKIYGAKTKIVTPPTSKPQKAIMPTQTSGEIFKAQEEKPKVIKKKRGRPKKKAPLRVKRAVFAKSKKTTKRVRKRKTK